MARNTENVPSAEVENNEVDVLVVEGPTDGVVKAEESETKTDVDAIRSRAEEEFGEEYDIHTVVVDGDVINVLATRKSDLTNVALRLDK